MSKLSFEEAKQKVAGRFGFKSWYAFKKANKPGYGPSPTNPAVHCPDQIVAVTMAKSWANEAVREIFQFLPAEDWNDDMDAAIWYKTPICEPPYVGAPGWSDWIEDYYTHFLPLSKLPVPDEQGLPISSNSNVASCLPYP